MNDIYSGNTGYFRTRFGDNPVAVKELRGRMRGRRAFAILTIYLTLLSTFVTLVYLAFVAGSGGSGPDLRLIGKSTFYALVLTQLFLVVFTAPAFTANAITGEREKQTYEILRTTLLTERAFVLGKLQSALAYVLLLIITAIPLQSIAFFLGGVSLAEMLISQLMLTVGALTYALLGIYFSSFMRSTLGAIIATTTVSFILTVGFPMMGLIVGSVIGPIVMAGAATPAWPMGVMTIYGGIGLAATNLPASLIISELILVQEGSLWGFSLPFLGRSLYIPSPWYLQLICYLFFTWLLYTLTVRSLRRASAT